ncbi:acetate kinase [Massilia eurypsychrophila]|uniref:Acetate kinase n=1 Tax=Massilia eurypsychrophila TaxID=1485217 RepID=A0A2G8TCN9_9BURK|nr:acetate/propionate family kinase [Massilia eurypsychrophila]PIL43817.1 acetate kinase [Massilia eurypsychrophila]
MSLPSPGQLILAINAGSSTIRFALFQADDASTRVLEGSVAGIGCVDSSFSARGPHGVESFSRHVGVPERFNAAHVLLDWLGERIEPATLGAIGHRVAHGGSGYSEPAELTVATRQDLHKLSSFDPEHLPLELLMIDALHLRFPNTPQVACFDTAFHHTMPRVARIVPVPRRYEAHGVRRYGFHGLSCAFIMDELERIAGKPAAQGRVIIAHLGGCASVTAVLGGQSVDTSMGLTPAGGLPTATRAGDLDPGLCWYLARAEQLTLARFNHMVNHESGLLGISESSGDMRELLDRQREDTRAAEAVAVFCYQASKTVCAMAGALEGIDTLVFSGGIGEHAAEVRARICAPLRFLGVELDPDRNAHGEPLISAGGSAVAVRAIHTDEQRMIVHYVRQVLARSQQ